MLVKRQTTKKRQYADVVDVVNMLFMPSWGCLHLRCEWFLSSKENTRLPSAFQNQHGSCGTVCWLFKKDCRKYLLPVVYNGAMTFLGSDHLRIGLLDKLPMTRDNSNNITETLLVYPDFRRMGFGLKTIQKYNIDSFFFQLVASNIILFEKNNKREVLCMLAKNSKGNHTYKELRYWSGFGFRSARQVWASVSYDTLLS